MPQLNLASEVFRSQAVARQRRWVYVGSGVLLVALVLAWGIPALLAVNVRGKISGVEGDTAQLDAQLRTKHAMVRPIVLFLRRLELLKERLDAHQGWSRVFAEFERLLPADAVFQNLVGSVESGVATAHVHVPTVDAAADVVASLQTVPGVNDTPFRRVEVQDLSAPEGSVATGGYVLALRVVVSPELFSLAKTVTASPPAPTPAPTPKPVVVP